MRKLFALFAVAVVCLSAPASSRKPVTVPLVHTILQNDGGKLIAFLDEYANWRDSGDAVRIDGNCMSACTLLLGVIPPQNVCATARAQFGFHSASLGGEYTQEGTAFMWFFYSRRVRASLAQHGWESPTYHPDFLMIKAREIVRACE